MDFAEWIKKWYAGHHVANSVRDLAELCAKQHEALESLLEDWACGDDACGDEPCEAQRMAEAFRERYG